MKIILFPHWFRIAGWIMFVAGLLVGLICFTGIVPHETIREAVISFIVIAGISAGALFIVCSKERQEDEMSSAVRLATVMHALYGYILILVTCLPAAVAEGNMQAIALVFLSLPVFMVMMYCLELLRQKRMGEDEEQD